MLDSNTRFMFLCSWLILSPCSCRLCSRSCIANIILKINNYSIDLAICSRVPRVGRCQRHLLDRLGRIRMKLFGSRGTIVDVRIGRHLFRRHFPLRYLQRRRASVSLHDKSCSCRKNTKNKNTDLLRVHADDTGCANHGSGMFCSCLYNIVILVLI
jgi:hypothetical protein